MRTTLFLALATAALLPAAEIKLPPPFATPSANNRPRVIPQPSGANLSVPAGFDVKVFAEGFEQPRYMELGPSKEILLSDSKGGTVWILKPERKKLIEKLDRPFGLAFWKDYLYVGETTSVKRYKYNAKAMTVGAGEEVVNMKDFGKGHWTRALAFDAAGKKLYVGIGSGSNVDAGEDDRRAAINRYNPDGSGHEIFAAGTRNPTSFHWYPKTNTLWTAVQERDGLGDDLVPDYFTTVKQGAFYGWPYAYIGPNEEPRLKGQKTDLVKKTVEPDVVLGAHVAVLDFRFYQGKMFPKEYQGGAFLAFHGSWNRAKRVGQAIAFIPFKNGKPAGQIQEFMGGWMLGPDKQEVWGRPVGILELPDGSLLVSDDGGNKVWQITYKGK